MLPLEKKEEIMDSEKTTEAYLRDAVKAMGGRAYKFVSPGNNGVPDRLIVLPGPVYAFFELKSLGKHSTPMQRKQQDALARMGCLVYRDVATRAEVAEILGRLAIMQRAVGPEGGAL